MKFFFKQNVIYLFTYNEYSFRFSQWKGSYTCSNRCGRKRIRFVIFAHFLFFNPKSKFIWRICNVFIFMQFFSDVDDVKFVINFDYPSNSEDYVHRIGRTGRTNKTGTAYTFFTPSNAAKAADLVSVLKEAKQVVNPKLQELAERGGGGGRSKFRNNT